MYDNETKRIYKALKKVNDSLPTAEEATKAMIALIKSGYSYYDFNKGIKNERKKLF